MRNVKFKIAASLIFMFCSVILSAQENDVVQSVVGRFVEIWAENEISEEEISFMAEELYTLSESPVSLNSKDLTTLIELNLLTEYQVAVIERYRKYNGNIQTIWEIALFPEFTKEDIRLLSPFISLDSEVSQKKLTDFFRYTKNEVITEYKRNIQRADGYRSINGKPRAYAGSPDKLYVRYNFKAKRDLSIGVTAKKDPGETFFKAPRSEGFDYYSAHAYMKLDRFVKEIAFGDYTIHFGNGLTIGSGLMSGKGSQAVNIKSNQNRLRRYSGATEFGFMRGAATTLQFNGFQAIVFASHRNVDANVSTDTIANETYITSLPETGYHRTSSELENRKSATQTVVGANLQYRTQKFRFGLNSVALKYDLPVAEKDALYRIFEESTSDYLNLSADYQYINRGVIAWGEIATDKNQNIALMQGVHLKTSDIAQIALHYRKYSAEYYSPLSTAFGNSDKGSNEEGVYAGLLLYPFSSIEINTYVDIYRYPWLSYRRSSPTQGYDYMLDARWSPTRRMRISARFRTKSTEYDVLSDSVIPYAMGSDKVSRFHLQSDNVFSDFLSSQTRFAATFYDNTKGKETGWMVYQELTWRSLRLPLRISGRYVIFNTDSYDTRLYAYEKDVLYGFSIPALSGKGSRYYLVGTWEISQKITLYAKWSQTRYLDTYELSSGNERFDGNSRSQFTIKMKMTF